MKKASKVLRPWTAIETIETKNSVILNLLNKEYKFEKSALFSSIISNGRLKMLYSLALVEVDRFEDSLAILMDSFVMPDIKEGEFSISHIWLEIHRKKLAAEGVTGLSDAEIYEKYPLPYELDFRMH